MKLAYFHLLTADNDDVALGEAKVLGYVPPTCLLGGIAVWKAIRADYDPCQLCNGPRERCGGREPQDAPKTLGGSIALALLAYRDSIT